MKVQLLVQKRPFLVPSGWEDTSLYSSLLVGAGCTDSSVISKSSEGIHNTNHAHQDWEEPKSSPKITGEITFNAFVRNKNPYKKPKSIYSFTLPHSCP